MGKTTVAAASAADAQLGYRTLVVSTDIAHSLADSLDTNLGAQPIEIINKLYAQRSMFWKRFVTIGGEMRDYVGNMLQRKGIGKTLAEEMAIIPLEEVVSLLHINKQGERRQF
ncbi:MAG: ArsA-related P-loop ATPase [Caldilineaceae bacterium]